MKSTFFFAAFGVLLSQSRSLAFSPSFHCPTRTQKIQVPTSIHTLLNLSSSNVNLDFDWKKIASTVFEKDARPIILFDGVCNLCNGGVNYAIDHDEQAKFRFASLQSVIGQSLLVRSGKEPNDTSSIVLVTKDDAFFKSDAVIKIASELEGNPILPLIGRLGPYVPSFVRNFVYNFVAKNRYSFGEAEQCRIDFDGEYDSRFVSDIIQ
jgi:predicted DCC family thiol-disulfide oxidoreductase YuxK